MRLCSVFISSSANNLTSRSHKFWRLVWRDQSIDHGCDTSCRKALFCSSNLAFTSVF